MQWLTFFVPESGLLLLVGLIVSHVAWGLDEILMNLNATQFSFIKEQHIKWVLFPTGTSDQSNSTSLPVFLVQHILIPPIILHASYELYNPQFFNQLGSILTVNLELILLRFLKTTKSFA